MRIQIMPVVVAGLTVLLASIATLYLAIFLFPNMMEEYYNTVFRSSSFETDWLFYTHPFVLSFALSIFWEKFKGGSGQPAFLKAIEIALYYGLVAILPVLWLTFSAIDISIFMVITWLIYGILQAFAAAFVFTKMIK